MTIVTLLDMAVDGFGERIAVGSKVGGLTVRDLREHAARVAAQFPCDHAHLVFVEENSTALPVAFFAASLAGVPFAPLNYRLTDQQLVSLVEQLTPAVVIAGTENACRIAAPNVKILDPVQLGSDDATPRSEAATREGGPDDVAVMLFTSGTTGDPKVALLRQRHLFAYVVNTVEFMGSATDEALLVSVPPYHIAGVSTILSSIYSGRRIVYLAAFDAHLWVRTAASESVTHAMVVPTMLSRILDVLNVLDSDQVQLPALRHLSYGGGPMPPAMIERALTLLPHVDFVNAYGLTETSSTISVLGPEDHRDAFSSDDPSVRRRLGSVGRPLPGIDVEIRGPDQKVLGPDERGEIYVRGEQVSGEYLGLSLLTDDGWFPTNDAGFFDTDGFLFLEGRLDDLIVRGAENLSPGEIEEQLSAHPSVKAACVFGVPDVEWGEAVAAVVVVRPGAQVGEDELRDWVRARLRSTRTPEFIEFRDELPYNETGKLLRRVLRDELSEIYEQRAGRAQS